MNARSWSIIVAGLVAAAPAAGADPEETSTAALAEIGDVQELSLADLLDARIEIATKKPQTSRETPGIVTVITRDEIVESGARDLLDVLALVPGFVAATDIQNTVGVGVRGQYSNEGKLLLLVDGQPVNDLLYGSLELGNRYPLEIIDHIEVIRGPGSAVYGGEAELAVINLVTRGAASLDGVAVASSYGRLGGTLGHASATVSFGHADMGVKDLEIAGSFTRGRSSSEGIYRDFSGATYPMAASSNVDPMFAKLAIRYRGLHADAIFDDYALQTRDGFGPVEPTTVRCGFRTYALALRYDVGLGEHLTLTPELDVLRQTPWLVTDPESLLFYAKTATRTTGRLTMSYDPTQHLNLLGGVESHADHGHVDDARQIGLQTLFGDQRSVTYTTLATFAQLLVSHPIANLTIGARYEYQSSIGDSFVPRVALTKMVGPFHAKLLASQGYRAPVIENINASSGKLQPERTTVFEAEAGYQLGDHMFAAVNAFDITISKPIIYGVELIDGEEREEYFNSSRSGTRGVELDYRLRYARGSAKLTYSYYTAASKNEVDAYRVPGHDEVLLAFPSHKVTAMSSLKVSRHLTLSPSAVIYGPRYGYLTGDTDGNPVLGREPWTALVNVYLLYRNAVVPGLDIGAGVYNLADQRFDLVQPYVGSHAPMPTQGREIVVRLAYEHRL